MEYEKYLNIMLYEDIYKNILFWINNIYDIYDIYDINYIHWKLIIILLRNMSNNIIISVKDLKKYFGEVKAVDGISFTVN